jgi:hypothetical protein
MKEIRKGQNWRVKKSETTWGGIRIVDVLSDGRFLVDIATEPYTRDVVKTKEEILNGYNLDNCRYIYRKDGSIAAIQG